jgi:hypothetical protein
MAGNPVLMPMALPDRRLPGNCGLGGDSKSVGDHPPSQRRCYREVRYKALTKIWLEPPPLGPSLAASTLKRPSRMSKLQAPFHVAYATWNRTALLPQSSRSPQR